LFIKVLRKDSEELLATVDIEYDILEIFRELKGKKLKKEVINYILEFHPELEDEEEEWHYLLCEDEEDQDDDLEGTRNEGLSVEPFEDE